jgi:hypothetical protein
MAFRLNLHPATPSRVVNNLRSKPTLMVFIEKEIVQEVIGKNWRVENSL